MTIFIVAGPAKTVQADPFLYESLNQN
jgi:hypothetical protein